MVHRVEKRSAFPNKHHVTFPQLTLFVPLSPVMASGTTIKTNKPDFFGLTCHIFSCCIFKGILRSPTGCVQTAVLRLPWKRRRKAHTSPVPCPAPSVDTAGWSRPRLPVPWGRDLAASRSGTHSSLVPTQPLGHASRPLPLRLLKSSFPFKGADKFRTQPAPLLFPQEDSYGKGEQTEMEKRESQEKRVREETLITESTCPKRSGLSGWGHNAGTAAPTASGEGCDGARRGAGAAAPGRLPGARLAEV